MKSIVLDEETWPLTMLNCEEVDVCVPMMSKLSTAGSFGSGSVSNPLPVADTVRVS